MKECVFTLDGEHWQIRLPNGFVPATTWNSKGAALAGLQVEIRRIAKRNN